MKIKSLFTLIAALGMSVSTMAAVPTPSNKLIDTPEYDCEDYGVYTYNVLDHGIDNTGTTDCTKKVQELLDACGGVATTNKRGDYQNPAGGTVYFPAGQYLFEGKLIIPRGVTIRGDWKKPVAGQPVRGTVFAIRSGKGSVSPLDGFITMQPSTQVTNLAFWYPDQTPGSIQEYAATVVYGEKGYFGNDYCNVTHCTFVNSYIGIQFNPYNGGGCPNIWDIYGTPLYEGFEMDCIADVGRFDGIDFAADYWVGSGLPGAPAPGQIDGWLYDNAIGVVMRRNDWSYTCNARIKGYRIGFHAEATPQWIVDNNGSAGRPNGHNYGLELSDCKYGVLISAASGSGIMFTNIKTPGCDYGVYLMPQVSNGPVQFYGCQLDGSKYSVAMDEKATSYLMFQDCNITGRTFVGGGHLQAVNNTFGGNVIVAPQARVLLTDNTMANGSIVDNNSIYKCEIANPGKSYPALPTYDASLMSRKTCVPAAKNLYVVTDAEFGAKPFTKIQLEASTQADCSDAIQKALDKAGAAGGGIVYLPTGHYPCKKELRIPTGVELKGASDFQTVPRNHGAVLEVLVGEGNENGTPFITMDPKSGIRGISINYPSQNDPMNVKKYPYAVRGNADVYVLNLAVRLAYRGLDLFTNKCDRHYVDYLAGHAFMNVVRIGGNSEGGVFKNSQCNTIVFACADETKFGCWPNSMSMKDDTKSHQAYCQNERDLEFLQVGDCDNEFLYNNFLFGCNKGMWFVSDGNGGARNCRSLGNAVDGAIQTFVIDAVGTDLNLVNSQVVALAHKPDASNGYKHDPSVSDYIPAYFIKLGSGNAGKKITFFSSNNWGSGDYMTDVESGQLVIAMTNMNASGSQYTFKSSEGAGIEVFNGKFNGMKRTLAATSDAARTSVTSSVIEYKDASGNTVNAPGSMKAWTNNLLPTWELVDFAPLCDRTGWKATADCDGSKGSDPNGNKKQAAKAIDGQNKSCWDTGGPQNPGDWFAVDFGKPLTFNMVVLDNSKGDKPGDYARDMRVEVSDNGDDWQEVALAKGTNGTTVITFSPVTANHVRVSIPDMGELYDQYWKIYEFYVLDRRIAGVDDVASGTGDIVSGVMLFGDYLLLSADGEEVRSLNVYDISGQEVLSADYPENTVSIAGLAKGMYVAVVNKGGKTFAFKFAK